MRRGFSRFRGAGAEETYDVSALLTYMDYFTMKVLRMQTLLPNVVLVVVLLVSMEAFGTLGLYNTLPFSVAKSVFLAADEMPKITHTEHIYAWLERVAENVEMQRANTIRDGCCRVPVLATAVRQFRVKPSSCPTSLLRRQLDRAQPGQFPTTCRGQFGKGGIPDRDPIPAKPDSISPTNNVTQSAWAGAEFFPEVGGSTVAGKIASYGKKEHNSIVFLPVVNTAQIARASNASGWSSVQYSPAKQIIRELAAGEWIDRSTSAVVVDIFNFHLEHDLFIHTVAEVEIDAAGFIETSTWGSSFRIRHPNSILNGFRVAVDVALALFSCYLLFDLLHHVAVRRELDGTWGAAIVGPQMLYFFNWGLLTSVIVLRFYLFYLGAKHFPIEDGDPLQEYQLLWDLVSLESVLSTISAWTAFLSLFRVIFFLRYATRLSLVSETLISGVHDFVGIFSLAVLVIFAYAITGHILWYHTDTGFQTLGGSIMMLFNIMISLEINDYEVYFKFNPYSTALYFVTFFVVAWCVLLNVTVGILATSFAAALETQTFIRRPDWSLDVLWKDFIGLMRRLLFHKSYTNKQEEASATSSGDESDDTDPQPSNGDGSDKEDERGDNEPAAAKAAEKAARETNKLLQLLSCMTRKVTTHSLYIYKRLQQEESETVTANTLEKITKFPPAKVRSIGQKSILHVGLHNAKTRQWKMLQKSVEGGKDITTQLSTQFKRLQDLHERICGIVADDSSGGSGASGVDGAAPSPEFHNENGNANNTELDQQREDEEEERRKKEEERQKKQEHLLEQIRSEAQLLLHRVGSLMDGSQMRRDKLRSVGERIERVVIEAEAILESIQER